ncbi:hypothetical protein LI90_778 [Carbonactinospora thermoautotrophica]|uniref:Ribbon-helix-helix protein CopG domain-containing protein n=1 Tax=Carbonactinospora thermoautotrophica TaxID=1469144 RepID=A0A132MMR3_9ACTN|nr:ribbon-helix-helix protein, CopG family [Carbonactinospora thermoautotrophica]KWW99144.1 hypothetical protein LI90_778 [Carbonactinospora thermoautotrophica]
MSSPVTTIKVRRELRDRLARLAAERHTTMAEVLEQAIAHLEREAFFARMNADLERLREEDPQEWESYRAEGQEWERTTVGDGLGRGDA